MNRRSFFRFLGAGAATLALSEAIPFGRVWSFPSKIVVPQRSLVGSMLNIRIPMRFEIGDLISIGSSGPYVVTRVAESDNEIDLYCPTKGHGMAMLSDLAHAKNVRPLDHRAFLVPA
jgi:hypothetical protein